MAAKSIAQPTQRPQRKRADHDCVPRVSDENQNEFAVSLQAIPAVKAKKPTPTDRETACSRAPGRGVRPASLRPSRTSSRLPPCRPACRRPNFATFQAPLQAANRPRWQEFRILQTPSPIAARRSDILALSGRDAGQQTPWPRKQPNRSDRHRSRQDGGKAEAAVTGGVALRLPHTWPRAWTPRHSVQLPARGDFSVVSLTQ